MVVPFPLPKMILEVLTIIIVIKIKSCQNEKVLQMCVYELTVVLWIYEVIK